MGGPLGCGSRQSTASRSPTHPSPSGRKQLVGTQHLGNSNHIVTGRPSFPSGRYSAAEVRKDYTLPAYIRAVEEAAQLEEAREDALALLVSPPSLGSGSVPTTFWSAPAARMCAGPSRHKSFLASVIEPDLYYRRNLPPPWPHAARRMLYFFEGRRYRPD